jgi:hypothetical protein
MNSVNLQDSKPTYKNALSKLSEIEVESDSIQYPQKLKCLGIN